LLCIKSRYFSCLRKLHAFCYVVRYEIHGFIHICGLSNVFVKFLCVILVVFESYMTFCYVVMPICGLSNVFVEFLCVILVVFECYMVFCYVFMRIYRLSNVFVEFLCIKLRYFSCLRDYNGVLLCC